MAEGGHKEDLSHSTLMGSEDGDLSPSVRMGSQDCYEFYCEPCDKDHNHVEAMFYCNNCHEYMCRTCNTFHRKFKQMSDHDVLDVRHMTYKPPVSTKGNASRIVTMATHVKDINVEEGINSVVLMSTNQLLVTDNDISKVILVDTVSGRQVSEIELSDTHFQVTKISDTDVAVTLPKKQKIRLMRIKQTSFLLLSKPQLALIKEISVQGTCLGIAYMDNMLIVTFSDGHIDILDMSGKVLRTLSAYQTGKKFFDYPDHVAIDPITGSMYVSDLGLHGDSSRLVKLSKEGNVLAIFSSDRGDLIRQVALGAQGMVYVALTSGHVEQLRANLEKVGTIIPDLSYAFALSYDEATQQLYVGQYDGVKVYRLS